MEKKFFGGVFVTALVYTVILIFQATSFIAIASSVFANLAWVFYILAAWGDFSQKGKTFSIMFLILMDIAFLLFIYYKVLAI